MNAAAYSGPVDLYRSLRRDPRVMLTGAARFGLADPVRITSPGDRRTLAALRGSQPVPAPDTVTLTALCVPFEIPSAAFGQTPVLFKRGAFTRCLSAKPDICVLFNFETKYVLGRSANGTASIYETPEGLFYECEPPHCVWADDLLVSINRGDISGSAAAVIPLERHFESRANGDRVEIIERAELFSVAVASLPVFDTRLKVEHSAQSAASAAFDREFMRAIGIQQERNVR